MDTSRKLHAPAPESQTLSSALPASSCETHVSQPLETSAGPPLFIPGRFAMSDLPYQQAPVRLTSASLWRHLLDHLCLLLDALHIGPALPALLKSIDQQQSQTLQPEGKQIGDVVCMLQLASLILTGPLSAASTQPSLPQQSYQKTMPAVAVISCRLKASRKDNVVLLRFASLILQYPCCSLNAARVCLIRLYQTCLQLDSWHGQHGSVSVA